MTSRRLLGQDKVHVLSKVKTQKLEDKKIEKNIHKIF